jgi:hypothetical protein
MSKAMLQTNKKKEEEKEEKKEDQPQQRASSELDDLPLPIRPQGFFKECCFLLADIIAQIYSWFMHKIVLVVKMYVFSI